MLGEPRVVDNPTNFGVNTLDKTTQVRMSKAQAEGGRRPRADQSSLLKDWKSHRG